MFFEKELASIKKNISDLDALGDTLTDLKVILTEIEIEEKKKQNKDLNDLKFSSEQSS